MLMDYYHNVIMFIITKAVGKMNFKEYRNILVVQASDTLIKFVYLCSATTSCINKICRSNEYRLTLV